MTRNHLILPLLLTLTAPAMAKIWHVGPTRQYTAPSQVMALVGNGDTVEIDAGLYVKDVGAWNADSLVLRCSSGYAHLDAQDTAAQRKAIWVINGLHTYVEGFEFSGCAIDSADGQNGAGIRLQSNSPGYVFECRRCYFHDNQEGILTGNDPTLTILIEACEFNHNGVETGGGGFQHNIYVGHSRSCTIRFCYFHRAIVGHEIKTRSNKNYILYNFIVDDTDGDGSYSIDMPNGGECYVIGNSIEKGPKTANSTVIDYGGEGIINPDSDLYFGNNTVVTNRHSSVIGPYDTTIFFNIRSGAHATLANNIFAGSTHLLTGNADTFSNVISSDTSFFHFKDPLTYDYHPIADFPGFAQAQLLVGLKGFSLTTYAEYVHPLSSMNRTWDREIGAFHLSLTSNGVARDKVAHDGDNFPNPFDRTTTFYLREDLRGEIVMVVSDILGNIVYRSFESVAKGLFTFDRGSLPKGIYRYRITRPDSKEICSGSMVISP